MEISKLKIMHLLFLALLLGTTSVNGQISTPCTTQQISTLTPCFNFITGSTSGGGSTPTRDCCDLLKSMMSDSMDCACLLITASVPIQLPINRTLALSLPRACKMGGIPLQCKASGSPLPAPGPAAQGPPDVSPAAASPLSPQASKASALAPPPEFDTPTPTSPPVEAYAPTGSKGIRPSLTPTSSAHHRSYIFPPFILLLFIGITM